jgi:proteasome lid subunit RPN8/RPN11
MDPLARTLAPLPQAPVPRQPPPAERPIPVASAIYWSPTGVTAAAEAAGAAFPIFVRQSVLAAVDDHVRAGAGAASLGLLVGGAFRCPDTGIEYLVIEGAIRLPWRVAGDHTKPVVQRALVALQQQLHQGGASRQLVGWYHSHPFPQPGLSPNDADTHQALFEPWQVALLVVPRDKALGGVFRRSAAAAWASEPLPFYELLDDATLRPDGQKVTKLAWDNYHTAQDARPASSALLFPDEPDDTRPAPWLGAARHLLAGRATRTAAYGAVGVLATIGLITLYARGPSRATPALADPPAADATPLARLDRTADTLALALAAFELRARLFERRQMGCPELAHGLVEVEERWIAYNAARKGAVGLDSARTARDRSQYADVDAVERRFERSPCPRP